MSMLVPFVIDSDSLAPDPAWTPAQQRACHNNLLNVWQRIGLLTHDGDAFAGSRLQQAVLRLPQNLRPLWQEVLMRMPMIGTGSAWDGTVSAAGLSSFANAAQLVFVDDIRAEVDFGLDANRDEGKQLVNGVEVSICRLLAAGQASAFQSAFSLTGAHIEAGDTYQVTWDTRFRVLARAPIKKIFIVDRYAVTQHVLCPQTKLSGFERFLRLLDTTASSPRHVTLYSAWTGDLHVKHMDDIVADIRPLLARLQTKNIKRLRVCMVPNSGFRDDGHDRFIRFEDYVWDIGLGLEVFDGAYAAKRSAAGFKTGDAVAGYKQVEQDLAQNADTKTRDIN